MVDPNDRPMVWISFVLWALFAPPVAGDAVEVAVLVHDPATDTMVGLRLSDRPHVPDEIRDGKRTLLVKLRGPTRKASADAEALRGHAEGSAEAATMLADVAKWSDAHASIAAMIVGTSTAVFEGAACDGCAAVQRGSVAAIAVGLEAPDVETLAVQVAVGGDAIDRLLALADDAPRWWPHRGGPASATLVAVGPDRAREVLVVNRPGRTGRRLVAAHARHLADVELPFQIERAHAAWREGDETALAVHRRRALAAGRRALEAFPDDATLLRRLRRAESLTPEHDPPGP